MRAAEMFKSYPRMKRELLVLEFKIHDFQGIAHEDVIESMNYSKPQGERVQDSRISDKTGKTAIYYRKIAEKLDDEYFDALLERYLYLKEELELFEFPGFRTQRQTAGIHPGQGDGADELGGTYGKILYQL